MYRPTTVYCTRIFTVKTVLGFHICCNFGTQFFFSVLYLQMNWRLPFWPPSRDWSLSCQTSSSQTSGCWVTFSGSRCWLENNTTKYALETKRRMNAVRPCSTYLQRRNSARSFSKPYSERSNSMSSIISPRMEVKIAVILHQSKCYEWRLINVKLLSFFFPAEIF